MMERCRPPRWPMVGWRCSRHVGAREQPQSMFTFYFFWEEVV